MYQLTEAQRETLLYTFDHLMVMGPRQGGMLNNAAGIVMSLKPKPEPKAEPSKEKEEK